MLHQVEDLQGLQVPDDPGQVLQQAEPAAGSEGTRGTGMREHPPGVVTLTTPPQEEEPEESKSSELKFEITRSGPAHHHHSFYPVMFQVQV